MNQKDRKRNMVYEALILLGLLALLVFICRLWPILLLMILGIFIAALRLLFLVSKDVKPLEPQSDVPPTAPEPIPTERDVRQLAYSVIIRRITEIVLADFPDARWIWENPNAQQAIENGEMVYILLNRASGFRRAQVILQNLQVVGVYYCTAVEASRPEEAFGSENFEAENSETDTILKKVVNETESEASEESDSPCSIFKSQSETSTVNYGLVAFEWVESHIVALNERCNEAIGSKKSFLLLEKDELPAKESWNDVCNELERSGLEHVKCTENGIQINFK